MSEPLPAGDCVSDTASRHRDRRVRAYFFSDAARVGQSVLGLFWLLDGALQFQASMYSKGFVGMLESNAAAQPQWLHWTILQAAHFASHDLVVWNTLFALTQVALGLGLLCRATVRLALSASLAWTLAVWWLGEAFGMIFVGAASPLTGAPGAVLMYALNGVVVWPSQQPGGLLGVRGARIMWATLWLVMAWFWLEPASAQPDAFSTAVTSTPTGISWLASLQSTAAEWAHGDGVWLALLCAALSVAIALSVLINRRATEGLIASAVLNLVLWVLPQGLGGMFAGGATDPNTGIMLILLAYLMYTLVSGQPHTPAVGERHRRALHVLPLAGCDPRRAGARRRG